MTQFRLEEVARLVGITPGRIRGYARAGLISPVLGARAPSFDFRDLVLLKNARRLLDQGVAPKKVQVALEQLKQQLDHDEPLSAVGLVAEGSSLIAERGDRRWDALSGQALFGFPGPPESVISTLPTRSPPPKPRNAPAVETLNATEWVELGRDLETHAPHQARDAFRRALELEPENLVIQLRVAALLERTGHLEAAAAHYRMVLKRVPGEPTAQDRLTAIEGG